MPDVSELLLSLLLPLDVERARVVERVCVLFFCGMWCGIFVCLSSPNLPDVIDMKKQLPCLFPLRHALVSCAV